MEIHLLYIDYRDTFNASFHEPGIQKKVLLHVLGVSG